VAAFVAPDQRVEAEAKQVHILRPRCVIKGTQDVGDPSRVPHAEPASIACPEKAFEGFVSERPDHEER
jgi:hypothetical protein